MGRGLLAAAFDFSTAHTDEFHDWYDLEHFPEREAVPGFGACERWMGDEQPTLSVATYDLDSVDVLRSKAYASIAYGNLSVWSRRVTAMCKRLLRFRGHADRIGTWQSITLNRRSWRGVWRGRLPSIRHGAPECSRTSATESAS